MHVSFFVLFLFIYDLFVNQISTLIQRLRNCAIDLLVCRFVGL